MIITTETFLPFIYLDVFTFVHCNLITCFKQDLLRVGNFVKMSISQILEILTQQICSDGNMGLSECPLCSTPGKNVKEASLGIRSLQTDLHPLLGAHFLPWYHSPAFYPDTLNCFRRMHSGFLT